MDSPGRIEQAARKGDWAVVEAWLDVPRDRREHANVDRLLRTAVGAGRVTTVHRLLEAGANPRAPDGWGQDALDDAVVGREAEILNVLLVHSRDTLSVDDERALADAIYGNRDPRLLECIRIHHLRWQEPTLWRACEQGVLGRARRAVHAGADLNVARGTGETSLMIAAKRGYVEIVRWLLENHADVNPTSRICGSALSNAVRWSAPIELVRLLLAARADVNINNCLGTPLILAARNGNLEVARLLRSHGASIEAVDSVGETAAKIAYEAGHDEFVRWLDEERTNQARS